MFTTVHSTRVVTILTCALLLLCALPLVVRSQEETGVRADEAGIQKTTTLSDDVLTPSAEEAVPKPTASVNPYPLEGVPGGDFVAGDFVVGPGKIDLTLNPGETRVVQVTVTNRTGENRRFKLSFEDAEGSLDPETTIVLLGDDRGPYSLKDYLSVPAMTFELPHNQRARIPVTVSIPNDAEPGGLYGSVLVETIAAEAKPGDTMGTAPQSAIIARIGTLFFITIPGDIARDGALKELTTIPKKSFYQGGPIKFGIYFENNGNMHLTPNGELAITNMFGDEVGAVELEPWFVLPQSLRLREVTWNREFLFGRYTATVRVSRGYDDIVDTATFSFWVLPWKLLLAGFGIVFLVVFLIRAFFRTFEFKRKR